MAEQARVRIAGGTYIVVVLTLILVKTCSIETRVKNIEAKLPQTTAQATK